jgi:hypothetical protein
MGITVRANARKYMADWEIDQGRRLGLGARGITVLRVCCGGSIGGLWEYGTWIFLTPQWAGVATMGSGVTPGGCLSWRFVRCHKSGRSCNGCMPDIPVLDMEYGHVWRGKRALEYYTYDGGLCHLSLVICHLSFVTCHLSLVSGSVVSGSVVSGSVVRGSVVGSRNSGLGGSTSAWRMAGKHWWVNEVVGWIFELRLGWSP